ncbi:MAG: HAD-IA family hydrolase [Pseudohongiellaceae bacterium]
MPYHTLVFDLDGTLTDPLTGIVRCMNYALSSHDHQPVSENEIKPFIGPPLEIALSSLSGSDDAEYIKILVTTYRERYGELGYAENTVYDGIYKLLDGLQAKGYRMGICTLKFEKYAIKVLDRFDLHQYFDFVSGSSAVGMTKADQLRELVTSGTIHENSLMVGDRDVDLIAARETGLGSAGVLWGYGSLEELTAEQPCFLAETPSQLSNKIVEVE